jgi:hypothetical protein
MPSVCECPVRDQVVPTFKSHAGFLVVAAGVGLAVIPFMYLVTINRAERPPGDLWTVLSVIAETALMALVVSNMADHPLLGILAGLGAIFITFVLVRILDDFTR